APPPPPPAPAVVPPAPTAARTYLVFFDWDGAALTGRSREIVAEAAQASTHVQTTRIEVNGYTDNTSAHPGPRGEKYNLGLSMRRADSVKAELIRDGVPANAIDVHGYGEAHPLVPTGPDTREPQNRRVEIILH
ncbi:OmpA family protein, partial [Komagataeibacter oboediens]